MGVVFGILFVLFFIFVIVMIPVSIKNRKKVLKDAGAERMAVLKHVHGLPEVGSIKCNVFLKPESILITETLSNRSFEVLMERVFKAERQVVTKANFSVGKAVVGEALAGPIGAFLAGSSGKKTNLLLIGYTTEDGHEHEVAFAASNGEQTNALIALAAVARAKISKIRSASSGTVTQL